MRLPGSHVGAGYHTPSEIGTMALPSEGFSEVK